jgi:hypothetical protein
MPTPDQVAPPDPSRLDEASYADWFAWARDTLGRDLEAAHAAAEAGYSAIDAGRTREVAENAARAAGTAPVTLDPRSIALAEWAYWARTELREDPAAALHSAAGALDALESTHSLDLAIVSIAAAARRQPAPSPPARTASPAGGLWRNHWAALVGLMALSAVIAAGATAGVLLASTPTTTVQQQPDISAAVPSVSVLVNGATADVTLSGFPPNTNVVIFVDGTATDNVYTDYSGAATASIQFPQGGHTVKGCLDDAGTTCPASTFVSRDQ